MIKPAFPFVADHILRAEIIDECPPSSVGAVSPAVMQCAAMMPYTGTCFDLYGHAFRLLSFAFQRTASFTRRMVLTYRQQVRTGYVPHTAIVLLRIIQRHPATCSPDIRHTDPIGGVLVPRRWRIRMRRLIDQHIKIKVHVFTKQLLCNRFCFLMKCFP